MEGTLYIISTPIGNLKDITHRALDILKSVDFLACEDTRVTRKLLSHYKISSKLLSYNDINEKSMVGKLIKRLSNNENIGLVSDAGTPGISDPGYRLVNACHIKKINVVSIPGASSVIASLSVSGLPTDNFYFCGFLPKKKGRKTKFESLLSIPGTIVIFESPYRVLKTTIKDESAFDVKYGNTDLSIGYVLRYYFYTAIDLESEENVLISMDQSSFDMPENIDGINLVRNVISIISGMSFGSVEYREFVNKYFDGCIDLSKINGSCVTPSVYEPV